MERKFAKGRTVDEQLNHVDKTLQHFSRRLSRKVVGLVPASPVFDFVFAPDSDGVVMRRIFPVRGRITHSCIHVGHREGGGLTTFRLALKRGLNEMVEEFKVGDVPLAVNLGTPVDQGDLFTLSVEDPEKVGDIWIGFLYEVDVKGLGKREFVIDQIRELVKEEEDAMSAQEG